MREDQADFGAVIRFILRGLLIALPLGVAAAAAIYFASQRLEPTFEAQATVLATKPPTASATTLNAPAIEASAYSAIALTTPLIDDALTRLGQQNPAAARKAFQDAASVEVAGERDALSNLVYVRVQAASPQGAARRTNALAAALVDWDWRRSSQSIAQRITTLEEQIAALDDSVESLRLMGAVASQSEIDRRISLRAQQQEELFYARALLDSAAGLLSIVEPASLPLEPVAPRPLFNAALAAIFAFFAVYGTLLLRGALDTRLRDVEAVREALALPVLAEFPHTTQAQPLREAADYLQARLLIATATATVDEAAPDTTVHNYLQARLRETTEVGSGGARVLLVTSPKAGEGKTTVALQLAEAFARHGHRTLLVDGDLRRPSVARSYRLVGGVSSLAEHLSAPEAHTPAQVQVSRTVFDLIPSFRPDPDAAALLGRALPRCLELWRGRYDVIVIDSAPLLPVADTFAVAPLTNATLLVANLQRSDRRSLRVAAERLAALGVPLPGVVVTHVRGPLGRSSYRAYGAPDVRSDGAPKVVGTR